MPVPLQLQGAWALRCRPSLWKLRLPVKRSDADPNISGQAREFARVGGLNVVHWHAD